MSNQKSCSDIDRTLDAGIRDIRSSLSAEGRLHLAECQRCDDLLKAIDKREPSSIPELPLKQIQGTLLQTLRPVRPVQPSWVFLIVFLVIFVSVAALGVYRLGSFGWEVLTVVQKITIFTSVGASAALLGFAAVAQMVPAAKHRFPPALVPIGVFVLLVIAIAGVFQYERDPDFVRVGMGCLTAGLPYAFLAAILFALVLRRGVILHPMLSGSVSGMLAGLIGTSVLEVHCPILDVWHILMWHLGVCILGALAGLLVGFIGSRAKQLPWFG